MTHLDDQMGSVDKDAVADEDDELRPLALSDGVAKMNLGKLRKELREARLKLDARELERDTFVRHIARQRESNGEMEKRLSGPLRVAEGKLREAEKTITEYRERVMELIVERERYKAQLNELCSGIGKDP